MPLPDQQTLLHVATDRSRCTGSNNNVFRSHKASFSLFLFLADCWWPQLRLKLTNFMLRGSSLYERLFRRCIYSRIYSVSDFEYWIMQISNYVKSKGTTWEVNFCWFSLRRSLRQGQLCFFVGKVRSRFRFKMFHFLYRVEIGRSNGTYKLLWHMLLRKKRF